METEYITKEAAIRSAFKLCRNTDYPFIDDIQNAIEEIPAADVRPVRKGHYIIDDMGDSSCSECGEKYLDVTKRFCPECGAEIGPTQEGI
jgi:NADH pyrophosphatase NudC (nudix superfamily)